MSAATVSEIKIGLQSAGLLMTPGEFDGLRHEDVDEDFCYELVNGVLVVNPIPLAEETDPNELLGHFLWQYQVYDPQGSVIDKTLPQQYVRTSKSRRLADRVVWTGLGRTPNRKKDMPTIAIEFVSAGKRNQKRDYVDKKREYGRAGIKEYWIIDRFQRTLTVFNYSSKGVKKRVVQENKLYSSRYLPGFELPLARILAAADEWGESE